MMKPFRFFLIVSTLALLVACNKDNPTPGPVPSGDHGKLQELKETVINGTQIGAKSTVAGLITDASTGKGIAGVPVTDGYTYTKTDANGVYQMVRNNRCRKVYYTTPAQYEITLDGTFHLPFFFSEKIMDATRKYRVDFTLTPMAGGVEQEVTLFMIGDPQCTNQDNVSRYRNETMADMKKVAASGKYPNIYAMTLGDITFDSNDTWTSMKSSMSNVNVNGRYIPYFQTIGNHDHDATTVTASDSDDEKDFKATKNFFTYFGPTDYSFDRSNMHIISMDDVMVTGNKTSSHSNKYTCQYSGGLRAAQIEWLKQDLACVTNKENKDVIICMHIQIRSDSPSNEGFKQILKLCKDFRSAHIMIGHTHASHNYIHNGFVTKNGKPEYEHIHGAACGAWWNSDCNVTGGPNGYNIYTVTSNGFQNWVTKGTNKEMDYQIRVWDGSQKYGGSGGPVSWYEAKTFTTDFKIKAVSNTKDCFVAEIWNDDASNWTVEFWQGGVKKGNFTRIADGKQSNSACAAFWAYDKKKTSSSTNYANSTASHYWYYKASDIPANVKDWEVRAVQTIPDSGVTNTYTCNTLSINFSCFEK